MTAAAALRAGAGRVTLGVAQGLHPILQTLVLEAMTEPLPETGRGSLGQAALDAVLQLAPGKSCLAIGPGLGQDPETGELVAELVRRSPLPLVIDADGLNHLAGRLEIFKGLAVPTVLTPHPGEMARLTGASLSAVQRDRIACARGLAVTLNLHVVLKGARTVIAHPDGSVYVNPTGNPGMASAGMGDVLTGMLAGLIAQGMRPETAARAAVYLHGAAADTLSRTLGPYGYLAGEVAQTLPGEIARLLREA
jgi:NAD(P)H-hydrate epimerase